LTKILNPITPKTNALAMRYVGIEVNKLMDNVTLILLLSFFLQERQIYIFYFYLDTSCLLVSRKLLMDRPLLS